MIASECIDFVQGGITGASTLSRRCALHKSPSLVLLLRCHYACHQDNVLIELRQVGLQSPKKHGQETLVREEDPILVVHPNFVLDA